VLNVFNDILSKLVSLDVWLVLGRTLTSFDWLVGWSIDWLADSIECSIDCVIG